MPLTREQLEFVVKVQRDAIGILLDQLAEAQRELAETARDSWENGRVAAYREAAEWGQHLRALVLADSSHAKTYAERRARELELARPKVGDFTGRLTLAEYLGTEAPQRHMPQRGPAMERSAA